MAHVWLILKMVIFHSYVTVDQSENPIASHEIYEITINHHKSPCMVDLPTKDGDSPVCHVTVYVGQGGPRGGLLCRLQGPRGVSHGGTPSSLDGFWWGQCQKWMMTRGMPILRKPHYSGWMNGLVEGNI